MLPRLLLAPLQKWPPFLVIYASYRVFTRHDVFCCEHQLNEFPAPPCPRAPVRSLPGSRHLPEGADPERLRSVNSHLSPSLWFLEEWCCVAQFGLCGKQLKWRFVTIQIQASLRSSAGEGRANQTLWHRAFSRWPGEVGPCPSQQLQWPVSPSYVSEELWIASLCL